MPVAECINNFKLINNIYKSCPMYVQEIIRVLKALLLFDFLRTRAALKTVLLRLKLLNGSLPINTRDVT